MSIKFSTLLLSGKAATLPMLMQKAHASYTPTYADILGSQVTQIQVPVPGQVRLDLMGTADASNLYGGNINGAATLCSDIAITDTISIVITGLKNGDQVFVATSLSNGGQEHIDPRIKIGLNKQLIPIFAMATAPTNGTVAMSLPLDLLNLKKEGYPTTIGSKFYMQTVVFPSGSIYPSDDGKLIYDFSKARISEMDVITVGSCSSGNSGSYGGTY